MNKETAGTILAILAAVVSGVAIPANKVFVVGVDPAVFTAVRAIFIGVIFLLLSMWQWKRNPASTKKGFVVSWKYLAAIAVVGGSFAFLLFFSGLQLTTAGRAAFLHKTLPLYVAVLAFVFLKERITRKHLGAMILMFIGIIGIYSATVSPAALWANPQLGDILVIGATILWAIENIISRKAMVGGETNLIVSFARMFFGGLILMGVVLLTNKFGILLTLTQMQLANIGISIVILFAFVFFYYWSLRLINASKAAVILLVAPVVSLAFGVMFLGEPAPAVQLAGSGLILAGAYFIAGMKSEQRAV